MPQSKQSLSLSASKVFLCSVERIDCKTDICKTDRLNRYRTHHRKWCGKYLEKSGKLSPAAFTVVMLNLFQWGNKMIVFWIGYGFFVINSKILLIEECKLWKSQVRCSLPRQGHIKECLFGHVSSKTCISVYSEGCGYGHSTAQGWLTHLLGREPEHRE